MGYAGVFVFVAAALAYVLLGEAMDELLFGHRAGGLLFCPSYRLRNRAFGHEPGLEVEHPIVIFHHQ